MISYWYPQVCVVPAPQQVAFAAGSQQVTCSAAEQQADRLAKSRCRCSGLPIDTAGTAAVDGVRLYMALSTASTISPTGASVYSSP